MVDARPSIRDTLHEEDQKILNEYDYAVYALTYTFPTHGRRKHIFLRLFSLAMRLPPAYLAFYHRERRPLHGNTYFLYDGDNECSKDCTREGIHLASL